MNPRTSLTLLGIIIIILGIFPLIAKAIPQLENFPVEAGSIVYQSILIVVGVLALLLSGKKKESGMPQIIMQKA